MASYRCAALSAHPTAPHLLPCRPCRGTCCMCAGAWRPHCLAVSGNRALHHWMATPITEHGLPSRTWRRSRPRALRWAMQCFCCCGAHAVRRPLRCKLILGNATRGHACMHRSAELPQCTHTQPAASAYPALVATGERVLCRTAPYWAPTSPPASWTPTLWPTRPTRPCRLAC